MKLNFGKRLVLFVHWLMSLTLCGLTVAMIIWPQCMETTRRLLDDTTEIAYAIAMLVVYLLFAVGTIAITFNKVKNDSDHDFIVVDSSETGRTRIAVVAVEQMIRQAVRGVSGIAEMKAAIRNDTDSISIDVDAAILNGTHVPTVTMNIQRAIRSYIELNCGVAVRGVSVSVHSLTDVEQTGRRSRRRAAAAVNVEPVTAHAAPASAPLPEAESYSAPAVEQEPTPAVTEEPAAEEPVEKTDIIDETDGPTATYAAPKKSLFKGLFGKRGASKAEEAAEPDTVAEAAVVEVAEEAVEETAAEEVPVEEPETVDFATGEEEAQAGEDEE